MRGCSRRPSLDPRPPPATMALPRFRLFTRDSPEPGSTAGSVPGSTPTSTPGSTPEPTPGSTPASAPVFRPAYPVHDAAGVIIGLSSWNTTGLDENAPAAHAGLFLFWLAETHEVTFAGKQVLEKALKESYARFCRRQGIKRLPWGSVLRHFNKLLGGPKTYKWSWVRGRKRKLRCYEIPLRQALAAEPRQQTA